MKLHQFIAARDENAAPPGVPFQPPSLPDGGGGENVASYSRLLGETFQLRPADATLSYTPPYTDRSRGPLTSSPYFQLTPTETITFSLFST